MLRYFEVLLAWGQGCLGGMALFREAVKKFDILLEWLLFVLILFFCFRKRARIVGWL